MSRFSVVAAVAGVALATLAKPALAVDAYELWTEFSNNKNAFVQKYQGQTLSITGPVSAALTESKPPVVYVRAMHPVTRSELGRFSCYASMPEVLSVKIGATITVTGTLARGSPINVIDVRPCTIQ